MDLKLQYCFRRSWKATTGRNAIERCVPSKQSYWRAAVSAVERLVSIFKYNTSASRLLNAMSQGDLDIIRRCLKSMQKSVRDRAQRILDIFVEVDDVERHDPQPAEEAPPLIDGVIEDAPPNPASALDLLGRCPSADPVMKVLFVQMTVTVASKSQCSLKCLVDLTLLPIPSRHPQSQTEIRHLICFRG